MWSRCGSQIVASAARRSSSRAAISKNARRSAMASASSARRSLESRPAFRDEPPSSAKVDAQLLDLAVQRRQGKAEPAGGLSLVVAGARQDRLDVDLLVRPERLAQVVAD